MQSLTESRTMRLIQPKSNPRFFLISISSSFLSCYWSYKSAAVAHRVSCVRQTPVQWSSPHPQRFKDNMSIMRARCTIYPNTQVCQFQLIPICG